MLRKERIKRIDRRCDGDPFARTTVLYGHRIRSIRITLRRRYAGDSKQAARGKVEDIPAPRRRKARNRMNPLGIDQLTDTRRVKGRIRLFRFRAGPVVDLDCLLDQIGLIRPARLVVRGREQPQPCGHGAVPSLCMRQARQQPASIGFLTQSAFTGLGQTLSYLTPSILVVIGMNKDVVNSRNIPHT